VAAVLAGRGHAADHAAATPATTPMADIADVYTWMTGMNLNLVMDVSSRDDGTTAFGPDVAYVFHLTSKPGSGIAQPAGTETQVICRFDSNTSVQCWVVSAGATKDYVTGDPSSPAGVTSLTGKVRVFAGRRSDPRFFNGSGFAAAVTMYQALSTGATDADHCPIGLQAGQGVGLLNALASAPGPATDDFATSNVMAIVVQIDAKSLVTTTGNTTVAVWASTHAGT
jgi:hypothetical protein